MEAEELINKYKNVILNLVVLAVAFYFGLKIYNSQMEKVSAIRKQKEVEINKNDVLKNIGNLEGEIGQYKNFVNSKEVSSLLNTISEVAKQSSVKINSIRPAPEEQAEMYVRYPFDLRMVSDNYSNIGNFIANLENNQNIFVIESMHMFTENSTTGVTSIVADLRVYTFLLKD